jgi:hypothetical protein
MKKRLKLRNVSCCAFVKGRGSMFGKLGETGAIDRRVELAMGAVQ